MLTILVIKVLMQCQIKSSEGGNVTLRCGGQISGHANGGWQGGDQALL